MKDFLGTEIKAGDKVAYITRSRAYAGLKKGVVERLTPKQVRLEGVYSTVDPSKLVVIEREEDL